MKKEKEAELSEHAPQNRFRGLKPSSETVQRPEVEGYVRGAAPESSHESQELIDAAEQLLAWQPNCSKGSSGDLRQKRLRAAIDNLGKDASPRTQESHTFEQWRDSRAMKFDEREEMWMRAAWDAASLESVKCDCYAMFGQPHFHDCPIAAERKKSAMREALKHVPPQYLKERLSYDYNEKNGTFRVTGGGYVIAEAEDSEVANAICKLLNDLREVSQLSPELEHKHAARTILQMKFWAAMDSVGLKDEWQAQERISIASLENLLRESEAPHQPSLDQSEAAVLIEMFREKLAKEIQGTTHCPSKDSPIRRCEKFLREVRQHPEPAKCGWSVKELIDTAEKLLEWQPSCSKWSSGDIRQRNLRAAIDKFKGEHPEDLSSTKHIPK